MKQNKQEQWEKKFEKRFGIIVKPGGFVMNKNILNFISDLLFQTRQEAVEEVEKMKIDLPPYTVEPEYSETLAYNLVLEKVIKALSLKEDK